MNNPLAKEQAALNLPDTLPVKERTARLRELLKNNFAWNGNFGIFAVGERKLQKERTANSATLNFALRSMLRDANILAYPVVMSRRTRGRLPQLHPSGESLNTMCLQVIGEDGEPFYIDAAAPGCPVGVLPDNLLVDRARVIRGENSAEWVDLTHASAGQISSFSRGTLSADGRLEGTRDVDYHDNSSVVFRRNFFTTKDSTDFVQKIANRNKVEIECTFEPLSKAGVKMHLGKGAISKETVKALAEQNAVFAIIPPVTALLGSQTVEQEIVAFPELGMEAFNRLKVVRYQAIIAAAHGESIYE